MRKVSPNAIRDDFISQIEGLVKFHTTGLNALQNEADQSAFTENTLLATAVGWEGFVSDMFVALVNRDATKFREHLGNALDEHLSTNAKAERIFAAYGSLTFPVHLSKAEVLSLVDDYGNNITFSNFTKLEDRATSWLIGAHSEKFSSLTKPQKATVNALIALRNHIAHRSKRSLDAMNETLANGQLHTTGLKRQENRFHNVGAWLKATPPAKAASRISIILASLDTIARTF